MFIKCLKEKFNINEPIFTSEILEIFKDRYSRAYIFRLINKSVKSGELAYFDSGVYYIPSKSIMGKSTITADDVVNKRYIANGDEIYGVYSGLNLQNFFSATTQVPNTIEIVTNNESMRCRRITIDGRKFILRKSRCKIDSSNVNAYTVLQLLSDMGTNFSINNGVRKSIVKYMSENNVEVADLLNLANVFPAQTMKNLVYSGVINDFTQR